jgi:hypothetical protein
MRAWSRRAMLSAAMCACLAPALAAQTPAALAEANLKAVFLFNFARYVTWPSAGMNERSPADIRICVGAEDTFFTLLKTAVQDETVDGKPLVPVALSGLDEARRCQILYVGDGNSADGKAWLTAVRGRQVLTVAEGPLNDETVIAFFRDGNRIRFDINRDAAARHGLNVSSKLLRLARQVRGQ